MKQPKFSQRISAFLVISACLLVLSGCQKQEGPMEKAGKEADNAAEKVGQQIENAGEHLQDTAKD